MANNNEEPSTAPEPNRWYNIILGPSFKDHHPSPKFCTLRYEFKPASIDKNQPGSLHKNKGNRVSVEFHNNQAGKPKVTFEGSSEDYKDNDAVLLFDGENFRLERLHRAVKRLRHVRLPGESASAVATVAAAATVGPAVESYSPPVGKGAKVQSLSKGKLNSVLVELERMDTGGSETIGVKQSENVVDYPIAHQNASTPLSDPKNDEMEEHLDIVNDDGDGCGSAEKGNAADKAFSGIDINLPRQNDTDDEIADVDVSDDEADKGRNAAEALRAQVNAEGRDKQSSSSSSSSGSESSGSGSRSGSRSGSGSGSSSSDSESSDDDSLNSV